MDITIQVAPFKIGSYLQSISEFLNSVFYISFNDATSNSHWAYRTTNHKILVKSKLESSYRGLIWGILQAFTRRNSKKSSVIIAGFRNKFLTWDLPNTISVCRQFSLVFLQ
jgi:hypothetical protein